MKNGNCNECIERVSSLIKKQMECKARITHLEGERKKLFRQIEIIDYYMSGKNITPEELELINMIIKEKKSEVLGIGDYD